MSLPSIWNIPDIKGKKVFLRAGLNVPIQHGEVVNDFRLKKIMPTLCYLKDHGARLIITSHLSGDPSASLKPLYEKLKNKCHLTFAEDIAGPKGKKVVDNLKEGEAVLFENLRSNPGEINNDDKYARTLATLGDVYVNEAFSVSHREHASVVSVPKFLPSYVGFQFANEVQHLSKALNPPEPFLLILGGAKPGTKIPLAKKFLDIANNVVVAGSLATDFYNALGYEVGWSKWSHREDLGINEVLDNPRLILPRDLQVRNEKGVFVKKPNELSEIDRIFDSGPETLAHIERLVSGARLVVWNGPLGDYEEGFVQISESLARTIAGSSCVSIVGGGDTVATIAGLKIEDKFTFVSTAGGAMLHYLQKGTLPGIKAIEESTQV